MSSALCPSRYDLAVPSELDVLCDRLRSFAAARGWGGGHSVRNLALALTAEVGELGAELQWIDDAKVGRHLQDPAARARIADEAADVLIYLVQLADVCGIDLLAEAYAKIERNESRFPQTKPDGIPGDHMAQIRAYRVTAVSAPAPKAPPFASKLATRGSMCLSAKG